MNENQQPKWLEWAKELQFIAQAGLTYSKDAFDIERFERIREISAEILSLQSGLSLEKIKACFCNEEGFQTLSSTAGRLSLKTKQNIAGKRKNGTGLARWLGRRKQTIKTNTVKEVQKKGLGWMSKPSG